MCPDKVRTRLDLGFFASGSGFTMRGQDGGFMALTIVWRNISSKSVKPRLIILILLAGALAISARAQDNGSLQPPAIGKVIAALPSDAPRIATILATEPDEPVARTERREVMSSMSGRWWVR